MTKLKLKRSKSLFLIIILLLLVDTGLLFYLFLPKISLNLPFKKTDPIEVQKVAAKKEAQRIFKECGDGKGGERCYSSQLSLLTKNKTLDYALQTLSALEDVDSYSRGCHLIAHSITLAETQKNPSRWKELLASINPDDCSGGFIHGVLEARSRLDSGFELNNKTIPQICDYVGSVHKRGGEFNCAHIMGHILMAENYGDIAKSNVICGQIPNNLQYECFSGVFMENETRENLVAHGLSQYITWNGETTKEQEKICQKYSGTSAKACWREIAHMYAIISTDNPTLVYKHCGLAPTQDDVDECYLHGVGIITASPTFDLGNMNLICQPYQQNEDKLKGCISLTVNSLMSSSPKFADRAIRFCDITPEKNRKDCYQRLGDNLGIFVSPQERQSLCAKADESYKNLCLGS